MHSRQESLTITLHWLAEGGEQTTTVVCEDSPPDQLLPLLLSGCGLRQHDPGPSPAYTLRLGSFDGHPLCHSEPVSIHGVRSGSHLWLSDLALTSRRRCLLGLPDGSEAALPQRGAEITRPWLLQIMALLHPEAYREELERLSRRESPYRYVSKRTHCTVAPAPGAGWSVTTDRVDVATLLNGARLYPGAPEPLHGGDRLTIGDLGPTLSVSLTG